MWYADADSKAIYNRQFLLKVIMQLAQITVYFYFINIIILLLNQNNKSKY